MVGSAHTAVDHEPQVPEPNHIHGALRADEQAGRHVWQDCVVHTGLAQ